ncbi:K+-transporting ATPase ATPase A chain [Roseiarcus fermentans]|uniref:Potassium-transporting ATPase potassium-binding subunit n=1 Tax=Roseiarcus fermentans TaxID=1473586 RepID=A0A366F9G4_9HYPH|nr:potassium-transporting ATPase subunit KdpA [Roseiarcus fermentans]RBP10355.1 K+-transporting ATPase ATPase A chain [Roseiarcus fermentans]
MFRTVTGFFEIVFTLALVVVAARPLGAYMADLFQNRRTVLTPILGPIERAFYWAAGVKSEDEQEWDAYAISMVLFGGACMLSLYAILRLQAWLPLNPQGFPAVPPDLAFNIAVSFVTNANWQAYGGETTLSHLSQMVGLTANNFLDSGAAIAIAVALVRALTRNESTTIGNFWVDVTRATLYVLLPVAFVLALVFAAFGVPQTLVGSIGAATLEGLKQTIAIGPVASQEAIKLLGDNGGGFFNANSAHPFENPSVWSNILQNWSQLVLPVALVFAFGRMAGDAKQGRALLITMAVIFVMALAVIWKVEAAGNPALTAIGVDPSQGVMEGKDLRFGQAGAALFADATTGTGTGASNAVLESMAPISGLAAMFNLLLGCISPGGVGTGLYSLLLLVLITAFIGALMIGRTPEYLGKKINARDMQFAMFALLLSPALVLVFAGGASVVKIALDSLGAGGPHGLSEIVYAYASSAADNGSAFAGLNANTPWWNVTTGVAMFLGRFAHAIPILAIAGSLAAKKKAMPSAGTLPTDGPLFITFLLAVIVIITLLQYLPALALGPVAEHFLLQQGTLF